MLNNSLYTPLFAKYIYQDFNELKFFEAQVILSIKFCHIINVLLFKKAITKKKNN